MSDDASPIDPDDALRRSALSVFDSDDWLSRSARAAQTVELGTIAGYRIVRVVQRGAQGTVYEAFEPRSGRRVAIKRLPEPELGSDEERRVAREIEALANLDHPNVLRLLAAPEVDGARVIVTEWIDGAPVDAWADGEWARLSGRDAACSIAACIAKVASGVAAAHVRGIMHRDLKPSNVLITREGEPKVLDFGLAREIGVANERSRPGGFAGTPGWAAPEQIAGDPRRIDARADVHALGLLLHRALAGASAFDASLPIAELFEAIRGRTPPAPSRLRAGIPRELDLIVRRALEKDPARRYPTADALRRDLLRHLAGEPVEAHPPSASYLVRKFVVRHRVATAATIVAVAAIVAGGVATAISAIDARQARDAAVDRADDAERARLRAERMSGFFRDLLASLREHDAAGAETTAREIIALGVRALEERSAPAETEADLRSSLGVALYEVGDYPAAVEQFRSAIWLLEKQGELAEAARIQHLLVRAHLRSGLRTGLLEAARRSLAMHEAVDAPAAETAEALQSLAHALGQEGRLREAREAIERARAVAADSGDALAIANVMATDALLLEFEGRLPEAAEAAVVAASLARDIPTLSAARYARFPHNAAFLLASAGRPADALAYAEESLAVRRGYFGPRHPAMVTAYTQHALVLRSLGRHDEAIRELEETVEFCSRIDAANAAANVRRHLGRSLIVRGAPGDAARAGTVLRESLVGFARIGTAESGRLRSVVGALIRLEADEGGAERAATSIAEIEGLLENSGVDPVVRAIARLEAIRTIAVVHPDAIAPNAAEASAFEAAARADLALIAGRFESTDGDALSARLALASILASSGDPARRTEARATSQAVLSEATAILGEGARLTRDARQVAAQLGVGANP